MPEYLAPGVYVEEIDTGSKPIEGVSTSTTGMVGVAERGPVNVPILVTGFGEYQRWFGGYLNKADFPDEDETRPLRFLPHAVEGFFTNGGKRVFVVRVLDVSQATNAEFMLFDRGVATSANTVLLRPATENTGTAANLPLILALSGANLQQNDWIRIGSGSEAEYRRLAQAPANEAVLVPLALPLGRSHAGSTPPTVEQIVRATAGAAMQLVNAVASGEGTIELTGATGDINALSATPGPLLEIGPANIGEHRFVTQFTSISPTSARVRLDSPLAMPYARLTNAIRLAIPPPPPAGVVAQANLDPAARAGETLLYVDNRGTDFDTRADLVLIDRNNNTGREVRRIGELHQVTLSSGAPEEYVANSVVEAVNLADANSLTLTANSNAGTSTITVSDVSSLTVGQRLTVGTGAGEDVIIQSVDPITRIVTLAAPLGSNRNNNDPVSDDDHPRLTANSNAGTNTITVSHIGSLVVGQTVRIGAANPEDRVIQAINPTTRVITLTTNLAANRVAPNPVLPLRGLTASASAGATSIALDNRMGLQVGDALRVGQNPTEEYAIIAALPNRAPAGVVPDAGNVLLVYPLTAAHDRTTTQVLKLTPILTAGTQPSALVLAQQAGDTTLLLSDGGVPGYPVNSWVRITGAGGTTYYHRVTAITPAPGNPGAITPQVLTLNGVVERVHSTGSPLVERRPLFDVVALDAGTWGNRLRVSVVDETPGLVASTTLRNVVVPPNQIRLASAAGVEAGTILELVDPTTNQTSGGLLKVTSVNRGTGVITLDPPGLDAFQQTAIAGLPAGKFMGVRSREFRLTVLLMRQPDPAVPTRSENLLDIEVFRYLSMDHRHSRYIHKVIGTTWSSAPGTANDDDGNPLRLSDRRSEGESWYIRVRDQAANLAATEAVRLGPETLIDLLPTGNTRAARHPLEGGDDATARISDAIYEGQDDPEPNDRTGLASLRNEEEIAIVAVPGRTSPALQGALIDHCELMRYRFAVLDGPPPPDDALANVQNLRQQFDTKYAALYHPWVLIPDPYPPNLGQVANYPIPPSGHVAGVYARTDIERGVHKSPANEVVRGIIGLQRSLNKGEQDILNPYPVNINVIRDFRLDNRGIRVFGGRVITSDPDWKYVNVRRLLIFLEHSLDRGLQWVVFEPNADPLWARVRRAISNFLTVVWRNGALEGLTKEEAYFVKCDRTTMTQTDIDNGRLIVVIGVAPVKPAEFVIIRIGLWTAHAED